MTEQEAQALLEWCVKAWDAWKKLTTSNWEQIKLVLDEFTDWLRQQYLTAGTPYGETPEGMWEWLEGEIENRTGLGR